MTDWAKLATQESPSTSFSTSNKGPWTNAAEKSGVYNIPVIGGILRTPGEAVTKAADKMDVYQSTLPDATGNLPQASKNAVAATANGIQNTIGDPGFDAAAAQTALTIDGLGSLPNIVKNAPSAVGWLKNGNPQNISKAAEAATQSGANVTAHDLVTELKQAIEQKFAPYGLEHADSEIQNTFGKIVKHVTGIDASPKTIAKMSDVPISGEISPSQLVTARQTLRNRFGYVVGSNNLEHNMANEAYNVLSQNAKSLAPGLSKADKSYATRMNLQKQLPNVARFAGIGSGLLGTGAAAGAVINALNHNDNNP